MLVRSALTGFFVAVFRKAMDCLQFRFTRFSAITTKKSDEQVSKINVADISVDFAKHQKAIDCRQFRFTHISERTTKKSDEQISKINVTDISVNFKTRDERL